MFGFWSSGPYLCISCSLYFRFCDSLLRPPWCFSCSCFQELPNVPCCCCCCCLFHAFLRVILGACLGVESLWYSPFFLCPGHVDPTESVLRMFPLSLVVYFLGCDKSPPNFSTSSLQRSVVLPRFPPPVMRPASQIDFEFECASSVKCECFPIERNG